MKNWTGYTEEGISRFDFNFTPIPFNNPNETGRIV